MKDHLTRDGRKFIIRQPEENDAEPIIEYSKILFASTDQVLTTLEEYTISIIKQTSGEYIDVIQMYKDVRS